MKKFATPLAISGTEKELRDLIPQLEDLGYEQFTITNDFYKRDTLYTQHQYNIWITNLESNRIADGKIRTKVSASNPDLVLALAAMTEGRIPIVGEYVIGIKSIVISNEKLSKVTSVDGIAYSTIKGLDCHQTQLDNTYSRKATFEEIIKHFSTPQKISEQDNGALNSTLGYLAPQKNTRQIIGYKVKEGVDKLSALKIVGGSEGFSLNKNTDFAEGSECQRRAIHLGILPLLFEPVYKDERKFVEIEYGKRGGRKKLKVEITQVGERKIATIVHDSSDYSFDREGLKRVIGDQASSQIKFKPTYFDVGCSGQYHNVSVEDIQKVIDALN